MITFANPLAQYKKYKSEIDLAILKVLESERYIHGKQVTSLESEFADFIGTKHAIGVGNGTDALELSLRSLRLGPEDEVITVSHTAVATVSAIESSGAKAVLVDIDAASYTIDPEKVVSAISKKTKALIAVHLYGAPANIDELLDICRQNNIFLIEDVSQAHGAKWKNKRLGSIGTIGCFSCFPTKNLGAIGDAGLVTSDDDQLAERIRMLREYGWKDRISYLKGRNSRLDEIQASILRVKLKYLDENNKKRKELARIYYQELSSLPIKLPEINLKEDHVYHLFVIQSDNRDDLIDYLKQNDIIAGIHYPLPVHLQPAYKEKFRSEDLIITEKISKKIISLPLYPELTLKELKTVTECIKNFFEIYEN